MSLTLAVDGATEVRETAALQTSADRVPDGLRGVSQSLLDRVRTAGRSHHRLGRGLRTDWCVGVPDSGQGGPEDEGGHDAEARPSRAPRDDVPAARAGQDPPQCLC